MIVFDHPLPWPRFGLCAHLISTEPGIVGEVKLMDFAKSIGMNPVWIQEMGTPDEHFDIMRGMIEKARQAGAKEVSRKEMWAYIQDKRKMAEE